jgi:hypothetical protein
MYGLRAAYATAQGHTIVTNQLSSLLPRFKPTLNHWCGAGCLHDRSLAPTKTAWQVQKLTGKK